MKQSLDRFKLRLDAIGQAGKRWAHVPSSRFD
jgi:hypothetical protein